MTGEYLEVEKEFSLDYNGKKILLGQVVTYPMSYVDGIVEAKEMYYRTGLGVRGRRLEVTMGGFGELLCEDGNFSMSEGDIQFSTIKIDAVSTLKNIVSRRSGDEFFKQVLTGRGKVYLKDTLSYLLVLEIDGRRRDGKLLDETVVLEKGSFYASVGTFKQGINVDMSVSNILFSKRQQIITSLVGRGHVVLEIPVRPEELVRIEVRPNKKVVIDDDRVICRVGDIRTNTRTSGGIRNTLFNKTKMVTSYEGNGYILVMPTISIYQTLEEQRILNKVQLDNIKQTN